MPWKVKPSKSGGFDIVRADTGKVVGHSDTKEKAQASVRARYAAEPSARPKLKHVKGK